MTKWKTRPIIHRVMLFLSMLAASIWSAFPSQSASAQEASPRFVHLNTADGLAHPIVRSVIQDYQGFIWIGTQGGLNRYDGNSFITFLHLRSQPNSLNNNTVNVLYEDSYGDLWVGTVKGLDRLDNDRRSFVHFPEIYESVHTILEDSHGTLWIGTAGSGLFRYDRSQGIFQQYLHIEGDASSLSDDHITALLEDKEGVLWIGTEYGGLNAYLPQEDRFIAYHHDENDPTSLPSEHVTALCLGRDNRLWVGTGNFDESQPGGLVWLGPKTEKFLPSNSELNQLPITALLEDRNGILWVGTVQGVYSMNAENGKFAHYQHDPLNNSSLSNNRITALFEDMTGTIWIATDGGGLNKLSWIKDRFRRYQADLTELPHLTNAPVAALLKDHHGKIWIGYHFAGLDVFDRSTGNVVHFRHDENDASSLLNDHVCALLEDHLGRIWIGTAGGLDLYDAEQQKFIHFVHEEGNPHSIAAGAVKVIIEDKDHFLWIGTEEPGTLNRFDPSSGMFTPYIHDSDLPTSMVNTYGVRAILEDHRGNLWLGTYHGLVHFERTSGIFTQYRHSESNPNSLSHDFVWSLYETSDHLLWIGTHDGLNYFNPETNEFGIYSVEDGLPDNVIVSILEDEHGHLWLATMSKGIAQFDPQRKTFRNFDESDGLQSNFFIIGSAHKSTDGELFFGGIQGFNAFYTDEIKENPFIPYVALTAFRKFDQVVSFEQDLNNLKEITLSYKDTFFSFEFSALDFTDPSKNQYAYRLEGFDSDWIYCGNRHYASYTNIPPGKYVFHVKGSNNDGVWNEEGISINLIIPPPFWQTAWFRLLMVVTVSGIILGIFFLREQNIARLQRSEARFRFLFENAPLGVCEADLRQKPALILDANLRWARLFQRYGEQFENLTLTDLFAEREHAHLEGFLQSLEQHGSASMETWGCRSDGSEFPMRVSAIIVRGETTRSIFAFEDITTERERRTEAEAIDEERRRIAREIHDGLAQDLAALRLRANIWHLLAEEDRPRLHRELDEMHDLLGEKIREARRVIFALRPWALDELGFWEALKQYLREMGEQFQLPIEFNLIGKPESLPSSLELVLLRLVQEALTNVTRHAHAQHVWIELNLQEANRITLKVRDDGVGFDTQLLPKYAKEGHLGLQNMRERLEAIGGHLTVDSQPGAGTEIKISIFVAPAEDRRT